MKFILAASAIAASQALTSPAPALTFCATLHQELTTANSDGSSDEVVVNLEYQGSCMNYDTVSWRQDTLSDPTDANSPIAQSAIYSGDGVTYFLLWKEDGVTLDQCAYLNGVNTVSEMPFSLVNAAPTAENVGSTTIDDVTVDDWFAFRPGSTVNHMTTPDEYMHWYFGEGDIMVESDCVQYYGSGGSGSAGNTTIQHGRRHYENYDAAGAEDLTEYAFPTGDAANGITTDDCIPADNSVQEQIQKMKVGMTANF